MPGADERRLVLHHMKINFKALRDIRIIIVVLLLSALFGGVATVIIRGTFSLRACMIGGLVGFFIAALCGVGHYTFLYRLRYLPFTVHLLLSTAYYTFVAMAVLMARELLVGNARENLIGWRSDLAMTLLVTFFLGFATAFVLMLRRMVGPKALLNFFTGRYHAPLEEERIFMFLDIVSSTTIAEKIGNLKFHMFLNEFYYDITDAILAAGGEIYKYVGDEVIISWKVADSIRNRRCIELVFEISKIIEAKKGKYIERFGFLPRCRAGMHCGAVIVGEIGDFKQEISFLGDTVNTTARIQSACKDYQVDLLISSELLARVDLPAEYIKKNYGGIQLKGKEKPVVLWGVKEGKPES